jgi:hypothetical protein
MYTWCEIVRYRAIMKAVFSLECDQSVLLPEKQLNGVIGEKSNSKTHCCGILNSAA